MLPGRIKRDESDVSRVIESIQCSFINPFGEENDLVTLSSGVKATEEIKDHLLNAESYGKSAMDDFVKNRLSEKPVQDFFDPIKKRSLKTFTSLMPKSVVKVNKKEVMIKADRTLFGRMAIIGQSRNIDLKAVFSYPLGPFPWSLADGFSMMRKTNKATIVKAFEKGAIFLESPPIQSATVIDGMALVQKLKVVQMTFGQVADAVFQSVLSCGNRSKRIDVVFDVYLDNSIKNAERCRCGVSTIEYQTILPATKVTQWKKFLSSSANKMKLISFLGEQFKSEQYQKQLAQKELYITDNEKCFKLSSAGWHRVPELNSAQEEADTRLLLHARHAGLNGISNIIIHSPDTDVYTFSLLLIWKTLAVGCT